jgi:hypothetical protein
MLVYNVARVQVPDPQSYPEELEAQAFSNLPSPNSEQLCEYCSSIPFELLGIHQKIRCDAFEGRFSRERPFAHLLQNTKTCFFCQKIALHFQNLRGQKAKGLSLSEIGSIAVESKYQWLHSVEVDEAGLPEGGILRLLLSLTFWDHNGLDEANFAFQRCREPALSVSDFCGDQTLEVSPGQGSQAYCGRTRPMLADQKIFKTWKDLCRSQHGSIAMRFPLGATRKTSIG